MSVDVFDEASLDPLLIKIVKNLQDMGLESTVLAYSSHHSLLPPPRRPLSFAIYRLIALEVFRILIREDSVHDVSDLSVFIYTIVGSRSRTEMITVVGTGKFTITKEASQGRS